MLQARRKFLKKVYQFQVAAGATTVLAACGNPTIYIRQRKVTGNETPADRKDTIPSPPLTSNALVGLKVFLDVGHGGPDPGAISANGTIKELDFNILQSENLQKMLTSQGAKVEVGKYTSSASLTSRAQRAASFDVFVSLHHNAAASLVAQGSETFTGINRATQNDKKLAICVQTELAKIWKEREKQPASLNYNRGVKSAKLGVLESAPNSLGATCLTESFFVSESKLNVTEAKTLAEKSSEAIAAGIAAYWKQKVSPTSFALFETEIPDFPLDESEHLENH